MPATANGRTGLLEPETPGVELRWGPLQARFDRATGGLRDIRLGEIELVRGIYVAVRDRNWGTIAPQLGELRLESTDGAFRLSFAVSCRAGAIDFRWRGLITGDAAGTLHYAMEGRAHATFLRNRIGFCVLHPPACAGRPCRIEHPDGTATEGRFPEAIAPHQPFFDIRALRHPVAPGLAAAVRFDGDVFEMEDQRNWTDASFKTYGTPLALPFPVEVTAGTLIRQAVTLRLHVEGEAPAQAGPSAGEDGVVCLTLADDGPVPVPKLGLGSASHGEPLTALETKRLQALRPSHLRVDLRLAEDGWERALRRAASEARALGAELEIAVHLTDDADAQLRALAASCAQLALPRSHWLIFHRRELVTRAQWVQLARRRLAEVAGVAAIGAGTDAYFTQLNRERPPLAECDWVSFSINPQVHAGDLASLVETLAGQGAVAANARRICGDTPVGVSPVTLKPRFNPDATGPAPKPPPGALPDQVDVRQLSLFAAGWTLGSVRALAEAGVSRVTYYETTGWRGVMEREQGSPLPERFPSLPGGVFPLYHVLAALAECRGAEVAGLNTRRPQLVDGLALFCGGRRRILVCSFAPRPQVVHLAAGLGPRVRVKSLDERSVERAARDPAGFRAEPGRLQETEAGALDLALRPYAVIQIDEAGPGP